MKNTTPTTPAPRPVGRPKLIQGDQVCITLRLSVSDRDQLRALGGAQWLRAQLAQERKK